MAFLFDPHFQAVDANGLPISGAQLFFYRAGTSTAITSYQNQQATTPHASPVVADSAGLFAPIYLATEDRYKFILKNASGVTVQTVDRIEISASSVTPTEVATKAAAEALTPDIAPDFIRTAGHTAAGDGGGALYKKAASEPTHAGKFFITLGDGVTVVWYELAEDAPTERMFGGVETATSAVRTAAIQSLFTYCSGTPKRKARVIGGHTITSKITIPDDIVIEGNSPFGQYLDLGFAGDMFDVNGTVHIYRLGMRGQGATFTGRGFHVIAGNDQVWEDCQVTGFASACLEYDNGIGARAVVRGGLWQRQTASDPAIVYPSTDATSMHRDIIGVHTGGGTLANLGACDNVGIIGCDCANIIWTADSKKVRVVGSRIANGAVPVVMNVLGLEHTFTGNLFSGSVTFGATSSRWDFTNIVASGFTLTDTSGGSTNALDIPATAYTPVWTGATTNPTIGNGLLAGEYEIDGHYCTARIYVSIGSTTTLGAGVWSFSLPRTPATTARTRVGGAYVFDSGIGFISGNCIIIPGESVVKAIPGSPGNYAGPTFPIAWATGDRMEIEIRYRVN